MKIEVPVLVEDEERALKGAGQRREGGMAVKRAPKNERKALNRGS